MKNDHSGEKPLFRTLAPILKRYLRTRTDDAVDAACQRLAGVPGVGLISFIGHRCLGVNLLVRIVRLLPRWRSVTTLFMGGQVAQESGQDHFLANIVVNSEAWPFSILEGAYATVRLALSAVLGMEESSDRCDVLRET
jgi:hypothetical protein